MNEESLDVTFELADPGVRAALDAAMHRKYDRFPRSSRRAAAPCSGQCTTSESTTSASAARGTGTLAQKSRSMRALRPGSCNIHQ